MCINSSASKYGNRDSLRPALKLIIAKGSQRNKSKGVALTIPFQEENETSYIHVMTPRSCPIVIGNGTIQFAHPTLNLKLDDATL
jgi:hypothetical protein